MPSYTLKAEDGAQDFKSNQGGEMYHDVAIRVNGSSPAGTLVLTARKPGSTVFETIPDGTFDLSGLFTVQFIGAVTEYRATISSLSGVTSIYLTDTASKP
jgi:hypothetical protein